MMQTQKGSLVIIDAHTDSPSVFFKGVQVKGVKGIKVDWDKGIGEIVLTVSDLLTADSMKDSGVKVKVAA